MRSRATKLVLALVSASLIVAASIAVDLPYKSHGRSVEMSLAGESAGELAPPVGPKIPGVAQLPDPDEPSAADGGPMVQEMEPSLSRPLRELAAESKPVDESEALVHRPVPSRERPEGLPQKPPPETGTQPGAPSPDVQIDPAAAAPNLGAQAAAPALPPLIPAPTTSFDGLTKGDPTTGLPPDPSGAIGPNHYMQIVNAAYAIYDRSGGVVVGDTPTNSLWTGFGGLCESQNRGDAIVLYDRVAGRWLVSQLTFLTTSSPPFQQCIAVSTSDDPTSTWFRYAYTSPNGMFLDYTKFGIWPDGYYLSAWQFNTSGSYTGMQLASLERDKMLSGLPALSVAFSTSTLYGGMTPADVNGLMPPPAGAPNPFAEPDDAAFGFPTDRISIFKFHVDWAATGNSTFTGPTVLNTGSFDVDLCGFSQNCIPQPGTAVGLDPVPGRPMWRNAYRRFNDHDALLLNVTVDANGANKAGIKWFEVRNPTASPTLYQQGLYSPDTTNRWIASMAMDGVGNIAMGYSASSALVFPSIRYTGRVPGDPLGTMGQGEGVIQAGTGSQTHSSNRWGDYSEMTIDPVDDCTFWYTNEYVQTTGNLVWRTRIAAFKLPGCPGPAPGPATGLYSRAEDQQINLFWTNPVDPSLTGLRVVKKVGATPPTAVTDGITVFDGPATTYTDVGLANGTQYSYAVFAHDAFPQYATGATVTDIPATHAGLAYDAYLAEGFTGYSGFMSAEYLTVGNVDPATDALITVTYYLGGGAISQRNYNVLASTRRTISVNGDVGSGQSPGVRISVRSGPGVVVERPMYFSGFPGAGPLDGGHDAVGAHKPLNDWYFAEGYTGAGFAEYLTLLNSSGELASTVQATYVFNSGAPIIKSYSVPQGQRMTLNVANEIGAPGRDVSVHIQVTGGPPVTAERPMYFKADPALGSVVNDGHDYLGAPAPASTWYFAEGYTGLGFVEYLTLQNPNGAPTDLTATYAFNSGPPLVKAYTLPANSRTTLRVNDEIGPPGRDVSVRLDVSGPPIVAERPMYFDADPALGAVINGGHDVVGANSTGSENYLAEGYTGVGFVEYLTLQNPQPITSTADITYVFDVGTPQVQSVTLLPDSRKTIRVNSIVGGGRSVSVKVQTTSGPDPVIERPMYFQADPGVGALVNGGHDVVALVPN